jgi:peroxiredoxin
MRLQVGQTAPVVRLPNVDGVEFDTRSLVGRPYLLSFYRFAGCPFCNLRVHRLVSAYPQLRAGVELVAVFDSPLNDLQTHVAKHDAPFPILADETNRYYRAFGIEHSWVGVFRGMILRFPTLIRSMLMGNLPTTIRGKLTTMPADFLIDEEGHIVQAYYGKDEGDHLPLSEIEKFAARVRSFARGSE